MSTVVSKNVQIGADGTASNNFTAYQPATPDGTLRIGNGNSGSVTDAIILDSSGNLTLNSATANGVGYFNGSKVLTSGSALTFDGTSLFLGATSAAAGKLVVKDTASSNTLWLVGRTSDGASSVSFRNAADSAYNARLESVSGQLAFEVNGSEGMRLTSTGLGIGTSLPGFKLDARLSGTSSGAVIQVGNTSSGGFGGLGVSDGGAYPVQMWGAALSFLTGSSIYGSATEKMLLNSAGNLGLGVTPSGWSGYSAFQTGLGFSAWSSGYANARINANTYYSGGYKYVGTGTATMYEQDGYHAWYTAPSGTAGAAISFTQAMTLDASGRLIVGGTSPATDAQLTISAELEPILFFQRAQAGNNDAAIQVTSGGAITFRNGADSSTAAGLTERARIDSSGNLLLNGTAGFNVLGFEPATTIGSSGVNYITGINTTNIGFKISTTEVMRIDASGNLLVGTTSTVNTSKMFMAFSGGRGFGINDASGGAGTQVIWFQSAGTQVGSISTTSSATSYNTSSDYRLKEDWQPMTGASERVKALKPVNFAWKADGSRVDGFLAHEAQAVVPEAVVGEKDAVDAEGKPVYQGIDQSKLVPLLTAALQEALAEIESLKARLDAANL